MEIILPINNNSYYYNDDHQIISYSSEQLKLNAWEGTCGIEMSQDGIIEVKTGTGAWWGCAIEIVGGIGENLSNYKSGKLNFEIKGNTVSSFQIGFQTGSFAQGSQTNNKITFNPEGDYSMASEWKSYSIPIAEFDEGADLSNVTALLFLRGDKDFDGKDIYIKNIYYTRE